MFTFNYQYYEAGVCLCKSLLCSSSILSISTYTGLVFELKYSKKVDNFLSYLYAGTLLINRGYIIEYSANKTPVPSLFCKYLYKFKLT